MDLIIPAALAVSIGSGALLFLLFLVPEPETDTGAYLLDGLTVSAFMIMGLGFTGLVLEGLML